MNAPRWEEVLAGMGTGADTVPPGFFTTPELAEQWGCSIWTAQRRVTAALAAGACERRAFRRFNAKRLAAIPVPHYRLIVKASR